MAGLHISLLLVCSGRHRPGPERKSFIQMRSGLPHFFSALREGRPVNIVYFGGSITEGAGTSDASLSYPARFSRFLQASYPGVPITTWNTAQPGTGAVLGAFRLERDVLAHKPDLVIVEFAINDWGASHEEIQASVEGIVRACRQASPGTDLLFTYAFVSGHLDDYRKGETPRAIGWQEAIAQRYAIPSLDCSRFIAEQVQAGRITLDRLAKDGVHPTDEGTEQYLNAFQAFVAQLGQAQPLPSLLPAPLSPHPRDQGEMLDPFQAATDKGWKRSASPVTRFPAVLASNAAGASLTLSFAGDCIGLFNAPGPDGGDFEYSVDRAPWRRIANFQKWCPKWYAPDARMLAEGLDSTRDHTLELRVAPGIPRGSKGCFTRIGYFLVNGKARNLPK